MNPSAQNSQPSKKSYEKSLEQRYATDYEYAVVEQHRLLPHTQVWHWTNVPEELLFESGYIHDYSRTRKERLMRKKAPQQGVNRARDYGLDGLAVQTTPHGTVLYHGLQAKYFHKRRVTAGDIGTFLFKLFDLRTRIPTSVGYLYTSTRLEAEMADGVQLPNHPLRHVLFPWKHSDDPGQPDMNREKDILECDLPLRDYQEDALQQLDGQHGINVLHIPCRLGKTLIAGHDIRRRQPSLLIAIAPLKVSVDNLRRRLSCFLPNYHSLLVDSDTDGTTDQKDIRQFLEQEGKKVIYSTFDSARDILSTMIYPHSDDSDQEDGDDDRKEDGIYDPRETYLLVDECHNMTGDLIDYVKQFSRALLLSATIPEELYDALPIHRIVRIPFSKGIEGNYLVDYTLWLPQLLTKEDGSTEVDTDIPVEFSHHSRDLTAKALYLAVGMLKTGARRCIAYMRTQQECDEFMPILQDVFENYHGLSVWTKKVTSSVPHGKRTELLDTFQQEDTEGLFRVLTSVRILDEAVDLPKCDSVFISSVGEQSSDIRFFQRCQRSSTLDPHHPMKRNHIFLWADGWESCVNALQYLRESDPAFHKKMRCLNTRYDGGETKERITREKQETDTVRTWSTVKCMTLEERMREKGLQLIEWVEENGRVPKQSEEYGTFWNAVKQGKSVIIYESILSTHSILRTDYERVQLIKEEKKGHEKQSQQYKCEQLIAWVVKNKRVPKRSEEWGVYWHSIKHNRSKYIYDSMLSTNVILKSDYENAQQRKEENKKKTKLSPQEKAEQLITWVEEQRRAPQYSEEYGVYWNSIKQGYSIDLYRSFLAEHPILKADYENAQQRKEENKKKTKLSQQEKAEQLITWVEENKRVPKRSEENGEFWIHIKHGQSNAIYESILYTNLILRSDYEKTHVIKEENKRKEKQSQQYKCEQLIAWVGEHNRVPKRSEEWGVYWYSIKYGKSKTIYESLLSTYSILKADYDNTKEKQEENNKKTKLSPQESGEQLIAWVEEHGRVPKQSEEYGKFWNNIKQGVNKALYTLLLCTHPILRADYDLMQQKRIAKQSP